MSRQKSTGRFRFAAASLLLAGLMLLVPALKSGDSTLYLLAAAVPCAAFVFQVILAHMFSLDRMVTALVLWLCAAGIAAVAPSAPEASAAQALRCGAGITVLLIGGMIIRTLAPSLLISSCTAFLGLLLLAGRLISPSLSLPVTEIALALLLISFASLFARQGPVSALIPALAALALLLIRGDCAAAVIWGLAVLLLAFAADGRLAVILSVLAAECLFFIGAYLLFPVQDVTGDAVSLSVLVSAGAVGADPMPEAFSALASDSLFLPMAGSFGLLFAGLTAMLFLPLALRGASVAVSARTRFHAVLAMGITLLLSLRSLASLLSVFGFVPLPGLPLPFLTVSLPDLCAELFLAGMLCGISGRNDADLAEDAHLAMLAK